MIKATLSFIKVEFFCYTACPLKIGDRHCKKKVNTNENGQWYCGRCDKTFPECDYKYILQCKVQDHTSFTWITTFEEVAEEIMGVTTKELNILKHEKQDDVKFSHIIQKVLFNRYIFKLQVKKETYILEQRIKCTVIKITKFDYSSKSKALLDSIAKL